MTVVERLQEDVPETIRKLKKVAGVTDRQIGDALGLSRSVANMRVTGVSQWSYSELGALAEFFGVPVDLLYQAPDDAVKRAINDFDLHLRRFTWTHVPAGQRQGRRAA